MPLRSVKMNRFILGFQRRVWCPKWVPLSSSCFMVTTAIVGHVLVLSVAARHRVMTGPGTCANTGPVVRRDRPAFGRLQAREVSPLARAAGRSLHRPLRPPPEADHAAIVAPRGMSSP